MRRRNERITRLVEYHAGSRMIPPLPRSIRDNRYWRSDVSSSIPLPRSDSSNPITPVFDLCRSKPSPLHLRHGSKFFCIPRYPLLLPSFSSSSSFSCFVHASKSNNGTIVIAEARDCGRFPRLSRASSFTLFSSPLPSSLLSFPPFSRFLLVTTKDRVGRSPRFRRRIIEGGWI